MIFTIAIKFYQEIAMVKEASHLRLFTNLDHARIAKNRDLHITEP